MTKESRFELRPTLDIRIATDSRRSRVHALVDSGSPITLFSAVIAYRLDIDLTWRHADTQKVNILGDEHEAVMATVNLAMDEFPQISWSARVGFLREDLDLPFSGVLGTEGFFEKWVVSFNLPENYFVVEEPKAFGDRFPKDPATYVRENLDDESWWRPGD